VRLAPHLLRKVDSGYFFSICILVTHFPAYGDFTAFLGVFTWRYICGTTNTNPRTVIIEHKLAVVVFLVRPSSLDPPNDPIFCENVRAAETE